MIENETKMLTVNLVLMIKEVKTVNCKMSGSKETSYWTYVQNCRILGKGPKMTHVIIQNVS